MMDVDYTKAMRGDTGSGFLDFQWQVIITEGGGLSPSNFMHEVKALPEHQ